MPAAAIKLVAMLLLVVQGAIALAPGRVLCIPVRDCGTHEPEVLAACNHCDSHGSSNVVDGSGGPGQQHGPFITAFHPVDECGCHLHVPVPSDQQVPNNPKGDNPDLRTFFVPMMVVAIVLKWELNPPLAVGAHFHPPNFSASDQVLALKTTRLLI
ncbi:MAG: hypothetical protein KF864_14050 [Phycisphaeraceae bacterium]|nr:hypothetical protein [Phycisphaeraceae bacterium]MBX3404432.1 hypothetical protein [Phycisphaeraceae bacterium]MBX3435720.1 hypothetical protein [Pirellulales bacterium]MCW5775363.1 hypothetical protein [Phycisphaeraceae bacterium]